MSRRSAGDDRRVKERNVIGGFPGRRFAVLACVGLAACALAWRGVDLQLNQKAFLQTQGDARHLRVVDVPATRGKILDRHGEPLAISTPVDSVWVNPRELNRNSVTWSKLLDLLGLDDARTAKLLDARAAKEFVYLKRRVTPATSDAVRELAIDGVRLRREYKRYYPAAEVAAHVLGVTNVDDVGQEGLELAYEGTLAGASGAKRVLRDRYGRVVENIESIRVAQAGRDLEVSIDRRIQYLAYRELLTGVKRHGALAGSAIVLDANSAEVLAVVNQPSFNPNSGANVDSAARRNRAMTDTFEPGSAIKPFTIASALQSGLYQVDSIIDTRPGVMHVGKHTVRDVRDFGVIDLTTLIQKSSNVGVSKVALGVPPEQLWSAFSRVGFGLTTGSGFPGEAHGVLRHFADWGQIHQATLAFGYGLSTTAAQLAQAYVVLANGGLLVPLTLSKRDNIPSAPEVYPAAVTQSIREMLEAVVLSGGTAQSARVPGYRVGGKTGTVRKSIPGGYAQDRYLSLFAGMAPMSSPRLVVVVVIDEPQGAYYGGDVAAPVFAQIVGGALRILGVPPDDRSNVAKTHLLARSDATAERDADIRQRAESVTQAERAHVQ